MFEEPFRGYAHVLAMPAKLDEAERFARRMAKVYGTTVYVGVPKRRALDVGLLPWIVWKPISNEEVGKLTYDSKLRDMPWRDLREMAKPYEYAFGPPRAQRASRSHSPNGEYVVRDPNGNVIGRYTTLAQARARVARMRPGSSVHDAVDVYPVGTLVRYIGNVPEWAGMEGQIVVPTGDGDSIMALVRWAVRDHVTWQRGQYPNWKQDWVRRDHLRPIFRLSEGLALYRQDERNEGAWVKV